MNESLSSSTDQYTHQCNWRAQKKRPSQYFHHHAVALNNMSSIEMLLAARHPVTNRRQHLIKTFPFLFNLLVSLTACCSNFNPSATSPFSGLYKGKGSITWLDCQTTFKVRQHHIVLRFQLHTVFMTGCSFRT